MSECCLSHQIPRFPGLLSVGIMPLNYAIQRHEPLFFRAGAVLSKMTITTTFAAQITIFKYKRLDHRTMIFCQGPGFRKCPAAHLLGSMSHHSDHRLLQLPLIQILHPRHQRLMAFPHRSVFFDPRRCHLTVWLHVLQYSLWRVVRLAHIQKSR